ncbi:kelch-like protein 10 [Centruroides sculpturatus]|uniref:kelch-like protein 10 n=1 Tax=Centruroides sculpturatus TaxID=218467 RepID=UPI000C6EFA31|nr:kelch-like protein 10 [Centruroides sculpturatus]
MAKSELAYKVKHQNNVKLMPLDILYTFKKQGLLCDAILTNKDGREFQVHRSVMVTCSPYFEALFARPVNEVFRRKITIPDISAEILSIIIEYAYTRCIEIHFNNVYQLLKTADQFIIVKMKKMCCEFLIKNISKKNCITIKRYAKLYNCKYLEEEAKKYLLVNFVNVIKEAEYLSLPVNEIAKILNNDNLNVRNEEIVWEAVIRWIDHDPDNRTTHITNLIPYVRFGLMEPEYFIEKVKDNKYVCKNEKCRPIIIETIKFLFDLNIKTSCDIKYYFQRPRLPHQILFAIGGWLGDIASDFVEAYDIKTDSWTEVKLKNSIGPRAHHKCTVIDHKIYVIGGYDGTEFFNTCYCLDTKTLIWSEIAPMYSRRCYLSVAVLNKIIYALGGYNGIERQKSAEKYNCETNQWEIIHSMNVGRSDASATTLHECIYIVGGFNGTEFLNSVEYYNPEINQWTIIEPMRNHRSGCCCISHNGSLYVLGGFNGIVRLANGEKYNPPTNKWHSLPDMLLSKSNSAVAVLENLIFIIGGFNEIFTTSAVECYDPDSEQWIQVQPMQLSRAALDVGVVENLPNVHEFVPTRHDTNYSTVYQKL